MTPRAPTPPLSVAPMMERTDRHFRRLMRSITRHTLLYTEMVTTGAILQGPRDRELAYSTAEHPIALQLGGDDPTALAECARIAEDRGYDEVNLNVGCPSSRVQAGSFGVSLMGRPERVSAAVVAMRKAVSIPVTVKHRIGFDDLDRYEDMLRFVDIVTESGCDRFTVHARKAWLKGLSPKENRNVPPLRYADVWRLKAERPHLPIEINGGIVDMDTVAQHLTHVDAVMIGRGAYDNPMSFATADTRFFGADADPRGTDPDPFTARAEVVGEFADYVEQVMRDEGGYPSAAGRHALNLYKGLPGARRWRRVLTEGLAKKVPVDVLLRESLGVFRR